ncbi:MAG: hypothetical protein PF961_08840 [Planctomycetota bacterium]|jgi:hypothetical protein|nr:hypothetical protein [Planctomycetota bacterium]
MTQILNVNLLAPVIQERLLLLDPISAGKPRISDGQPRALLDMNAPDAAVAEWAR